MNVETQKTGAQEPESRWYALYIKHHHEKKAADLLMRKKIEVFLPLYRDVRQWKGRKKTIALPLFPGYLFLRSDLRDKTEILRTPGVFFLVENSGHACPVPDYEIEAIQRVVNSEMEFQPHPFLKSGEHVEIRSGPLAGVRGIFVRNKNQHRIVVAVEVLQKAVSVEVSLENVQKAGPSAAGEFMRLEIESHGSRAVGA